MTIPRRDTVSIQGEQDVKKSALDRRLDSIGWGLFLVMIGGLWLAPEGRIPEGTWLIGTGLIILGTSLVRYFNDIKVSGFWVFLGVLALASGVGDVFGVNLPVFALLLILIGGGILFDIFVKNRES
jgi:hypothetical protein